MQQYRAIAASSLSEREKVAAIGTIMGTELTTESGAPSQYAKMTQLLDSGVALEQYLDLNEAGAVDGYLKYQTAAQGRDYGITPDIMISFTEMLPDFDADGNGSFTQAEVKTAIDALSNGGHLPSIGGAITFQLTGGGLSNSQKAVLWQLYNKSWKAKNNPFDVTIGQWIYDGLHGEPAPGILPSLGGGAGSGGTGGVLQGLSLPSLAG